MSEPYYRDEPYLMIKGELVPELRQMAGQILTPTSRSKKFFNECADKIEALETRNRQLVQAILDVEKAWTKRSEGELIQQLFELAKQQNK